jgi:hypothetical protein
MGRAPYFARAGAATPGRQKRTIAEAAKSSWGSAAAADAALPRYPIYFLLLSAIARFCPTRSRCFLVSYRTLACFFLTHLTTAKRRNALNIDCIHH